MASEQLAKKQKLGTLADSIKAATPSGGDLDAIVPLAQDEVAATSIQSVGPSGKHSSKTKLALALSESSSLKSSPLSLVDLGSPVVNNRFKLDNRPTVFKVVPPLPDGLADVSFHSPFLHFCFTKTCKMHVQALYSQAREIPLLKPS